MGLMQTFLPYADFYESARVLDRYRHGNQRNEAMGILRINLGEADGGGWRNHPAVKMWEGYPAALAAYGCEVCRAWVDKGYKDTVFRRFQLYLLGLGDIILPPWLGNTDFHSSHRAALLFKNPEWYGQFKWLEEPKMAYLWPGRDL